MSKENMTMDEAYTCPRCGGQAVNVGAMEQIFSDARSEEITCMKCGSSWIVYYKMFEFNTKNLNITDTPIDDETKTGITEDGILEDKQDVADQLEIDPSLLQEIPCTVMPDETPNEVPDYHVVTDDGTKPGIATTDNN